MKVGEFYEKLKDTISTRVIIYIDGNKNYENYLYKQKPFDHLINKEIIDIGTTYDGDIIIYVY